MATKQLPPKSSSGTRPGSNPSSGSLPKGGQSGPSNTGVPAKPSGIPSRDTNATPSQLPRVSGYGHGERLTSGLWWMSLGAALVDPKVAARLLASPTTGWPSTPAAFLDAMRIASERQSLRTWLWAWLRQQGVEVAGDARIIDGILAYVELVAAKERNAAIAREVATRAKLMPPAAFCEWLETLHQPAIAGKIESA